jgi:hypothetical protein
MKKKSEGNLINFTRSEDLGEGPGMVVYIFNTSYSGGGDHGNHSSKPTQAKS